MRRKVLLTIVLILAILLQSIIPLTVVNASTGVEITLDSELYAAIRNQLVQKNIEATYDDANCKIIMTQENLEKVTSLDLSNSNIDNLQNLNLFTNLKELNLTANNLSSDDECHLEVLSALSLEKLNLSSNKLESVDKITNFDNIKYSDITNQEVTGSDIIVVDVSDESNHLKTATITLPNILLEDTGMIEADWITAEVTGNASVDWVSVKENSTDIVLNVASGNADSYKANKGLIKIIVDVKDSDSKLANTKMTFYYAIIDSNETGIAFKDKNLYKAIKTQLTAGQTENTELRSYGTSNSTTLYSRAYDEALILVIDTNVLINDIPSLIIHDKKIVDLTGIEEFIGLDIRLNVSYNYIDSIEKIIELEKNKDIKEKELQARYSKLLEVLKGQKDNLTKAEESVKNLTKQIEDKDTEIQKLDPSKEGYEDQKAALIKEWNDLSEQKTDAELEVEKYTILLSETLDKLYSTYAKEYKLTTILPISVNKISVDDLLEADLETSKAYANEIIAKVSNLENTDALTFFESWAITEQFSIPTTKKVTVKNDDGTTTEEIKEIENPISEYFKTFQENAELLTIADYQKFVYNFKCIDVLAQVNNYCIIQRMDNGDETCYIEEALKVIKAELEAKDLDTSLFARVSHITGCQSNSTGSTVNAYHLYFTDTNFGGVHLGIADEHCTGAITVGDYVTLAKKLSNVTAEEITTYITLPRIQSLVLEDNKISSLTGLEELSELKELNAYKNTLGTINNVDWTKFPSLKRLDLGYNQLSDIKVLEILTKLEYLNVSKNLLKGNFDFYLAGMKDLKYVDFSNNQYSNIAYLVNQFTFLAKAHNMEVEDYLISSYAPEISFKYQTLNISTTIVKEGELVTIELPRIFAQFEEIDNARTSYGITSQNGTVLADGTGVVLTTPAVGEYKGIVTVDGRHGNGYTTNGIGFGSTCTIDYKVVEKVDEGTTPETPDTPVDPEKPVDPGTPDTPVTPENPVQPEYGYTVSDGYVSVFTPETSIADFAERLVSLEEYNVKVVNSKDATNNIATGAVVSIDTKDGKEVAILEVIVKGDVNGDGEIDAIDSGIIRNVINDTTALVGVYNEAADVNCDGDVDSLDALLVLKYRADKISSFED